MWLTDVSIRRPVFIAMFVLALVVLGIRSRSDMKAELYPKIDFPFITIVTAYPGAGPQEIETLVTDPIEEAVGGVANLKNVTSTSRDGVSIVGMEFEIGTDLDAAAADVRDKVAATRGSLPRDAEDPTVLKFDVSAMPVMSLGVFGKRSAREIRQIADDVIKDRLSRVKGVSAVYVSGGDTREISVAVDKERLQAYGLSIGQVAQAIAAENLNVPAGTIKEQTREYSIRMVGEFKTVDQLREMRIAVPAGPQSKEFVVRLGDIAEITDTVAEKDTLTRLNGREAVTMAVQKQSDANTVEVADGVCKELERLKRILPSDIDIIVTSDQSTFVRDALNDVNRSLEEGILLVVLIVFLFLHSGRATFIVGLAIPTSLLATFMPMRFAGFTLNMMTMLALSLVVGILVDDSIVVLENIHRHLKLGEPPREAAFNGRTEIGLAAITITLTDVVVFVPIAFMSGIVGQFFRQFGITVAVATLFSLLMSFTLTPMLASRWMKPEGREEDEASRRGPVARLFGAFDRFYSALDSRYRAVLAWALMNRWVVIAIGTSSLLTVFAMMAPAGPARVAIAGIIALAGLLATATARDRLVPITFTAALVAVALIVHFPFGFEMMPDVDRGEFAISVEMPAGTSLQKTDSVVRQIEAVLAKMPKEVQYYATTVGSTSASGGMGGGDEGPQYARISVKLIDRLPRHGGFFGFFRKPQRRPIRDVMDQIVAETAHIPATAIRVTQVSGMGRSEAPIQMEVTGPDLNEINRVANAIAARMQKVPGVTDVQLSSKLGKPEFQVQIDRLRAAEYGLTAAQIGMAVRTAFAGNIDSKFRQGGDEWDIRVWLTKDDRTTTRNIGDIVVGNKNGVPVYLKDVATISVAPAPNKIERKNRERLVTVSANLATGYRLGNVQQAINRAIADIPLGSTAVNAGGTSEIMRESFGNMGSALLLSIALVYMLMAALFESLFSPFIIMFSLPQAMVGALLALLITGNTLSIISNIGIIMLMGLVTKNAILLVDYTNTLRGRGLKRDDAILEAGPTRLRPILMTTLAMVGGMLPTALAATNGSEMRAPMAIAVIGGLLLSTLLTLVVIPVTYTIVDDWVNSLTRRIKRLRAGAPERAEALVGGD
ncbi:MAG: efflux RND transporter permease subunit [Armatimonadota bacterium]